MRAITVQQGECREYVAYLEGEGQANGVEAHQLYAPGHSVKILGDGIGSLPQAVHSCGACLESKPANNARSSGIKATRLEGSWS